MADSLKYVQAQDFSLAGSGAVIGNTSVTLKSFKTIDGVNLTMTDFGVIAFGTLEPGNGTLEEQISFAGVTQNANGTATLTTVKSVAFIAPYTQTAGLLKTHAGSTTFVISNTAGFYDSLSGKDNDETVTGTWTFPSTDATRARVTSDTDTAVATAFVTLGQLSRQAISGASNASTTVKGIVELATQAEVDARTTTGGTGALLVPTPDTQRSTLLSDYMASTGTANAYVITPVPAITAYTAGQIFSFRATNANTTTSTLNVSALGVKTINKVGGGTALVANDILAGQIVMVEYDGTNFQMLTALGNAPSTVQSADIQTFTSNGTWTKPALAKVVEVYVIGAGGGGGSGRRENGGASTAFGGAGGGGGGFGYKKFNASVLAATETITVGAGGAGGAGQNTNSTNGNAGTVGGASSFGTTVYMRAPGGSAGLGGTNASGAAAVGNQGNGDFSQVGGNSGGSNSPGDPGVDTALLVSPRGGGAGGRGDNTGGVGGGFITNFVLAGGAAGTIGNAPSTSLIIGGTGGGGSNGSAGGASSVGGAGVIGSGGGGSGGAGGGASGAGGAGGAGMIVVITYF